MLKITPKDYQNMVKLYNDPQRINASRSQEVQTSRSKNSPDTHEGLDRVDDVSISKDYQLYDRAMKELSMTDNHDHKIKTLSAQIENGTYHIDVKKISKHIIKNANK